MDLNINCLLKEEIISALINPFNMSAIFLLLWSQQKSTVNILYNRLHLNSVCVVIFYLFIYQFIYFSVAISISFFLLAPLTYTKNYFRCLKEKPSFTGKNRVLRRVTVRVGSRCLNYVVKMCNFLILFAKIHIVHSY